MSGAKPEMQKAADTTDMSVLFFQMVLIFGKATHKTMQTLVLAASHSGLKQGVRWGVAGGTCSTGCPLTAAHRTSQDSRHMFILDFLSASSSQNYNF